ncbi:MAG: methylaspartate ammonia-lyase [Anaerospora sp.]|nr:methylaspartate ammonia-lyase [Anaerospora sp.]
MCEVIAEEYNTQVSDREIPVFAQSGDDRYLNPDKMIIKKAQVLPHALINNVKEKLGGKGELLLEYVEWLRNRILAIRSSEEYQPTLHIDVYGTFGLAFNNEIEPMIAYFRQLEKAAAPLKLRIEGPVDVEDRDKHWQTLNCLLTNVPVICCKLKLLTLAVLTTPSKQCYTVKKKVSVLTRAVLAMRPTVPHKYAFISQWLLSLCKCWPSQAWALTKA